MSPGVSLATVQLAASGQGDLDHGTDRWNSNTSSARRASARPIRRSASTASGRAMSQNALRLDCHEASPTTGTVIP